MGQRLDMAYGRLEARLRYQRLIGFLSLLIFLLLRQNTKCLMLKEERFVWLTVRRGFSSWSTGSQADWYGRIEIVHSNAGVAEGI